MKYNQTFRVGIREVGFNNQITNYGILAFLEDIATYHSDTIGYGIKDIINKKRAWLLMDWELEVFKRAKFGDIISVNTYSVSLKKPSFHCYRNFEVYNDKNELIATATSKWLLYDTDKNKITKLDENTLKPFNSEGDPCLSEKKLLKLTEPASYNSCINYKVNRDDIDINKHMNNLNYLKLAYEIIPEEMFLENQLDNLRIMYKHQIKFGEEVKCFYSKQEDGHYITIKSNDEKILHAIVKLW